ncbi:hypothetical protein CNMCM7691_007451 [Aspergillus felis]|uniref:S-adenosyl-L-methionine-dependent methyltransferase n=1 Tax=Aspergillus felis TaxID=1287682 RepID=A0A8H6QUU1_9EURO|nr:hypothetical protein CNMCM7691_007451 [Aspergillus felis]
MNPITWFLGLIQRLWKFIFSPKQRDKNLYGLDHAILHVQTPPPSMWMNMGYWKDETTLAGAAQALLDQVLIAAGLVDPSGRPVPHPPQRRFNLLDVGIGCGDQSLHLLNTARLPRIVPGDGDDDDSAAARPLPLFDAYVGVTIAPPQAEMARQRVRSQVEEAATSPSKAEIFCADAADPSSWSAEMKDALRGMIISEEIGMYSDNWVLALDMLYHLRPSRRPLISYACRDLRASLMAFDLLLSDKASLWERLMLRLVCMVTGTPFSNFLTRAEYEDLLVGAGYGRDCVQMRDLSDHVFAGLAGFIARKDEELRRFGMTVGKFRGAGAVFGWWARSGVVRGTVIIAKRQGL